MVGLHLPEHPAPLGSYGAGTPGPAPRRGGGFATDLGGGGGGVMDSPEVTFTLAYLVLAVCFVFTPTEFHSAGLTVQNLLSGWLGSEDAAFVRYHQRRTAATLLCHSLLPLGEARSPPLPSSGVPGGRAAGTPPSEGRVLGSPVAPSARGGGPTARVLHAGGIWAVAGGSRRAPSPGEGCLAPLGRMENGPVDGQFRGEEPKLTDSNGGTRWPWPRPGKVGVGRAGGDG